MNFYSMLPDSYRAVEAKIVADEESDYTIMIEADRGDEVIFHFESITEMSDFALCVCSAVLKIIQGEKAADGHPYAEVRFPQREPVDPEDEL